MKLADFGLARVFGSPNAGRYTDQARGPAVLCAALTPLCCASLLHAAAPLCKPRGLRLGLAPPFPRCAPVT